MFRGVPEAVLHNYHFFLDRFSLLWVISGFAVLDCCSAGKDTNTNNKNKTVQNFPDFM